MIFMVFKTDKNFVTKVDFCGFAPILPSAKPFLRFKTLVMLTAHWAGEKGSKNEIGKKKSVDCNHN